MMPPNKAIIMTNKDESSYSQILQDITHFFKKINPSFTPEKPTIENKVGYLGFVNVAGSKGEPILIIAAEITRNRAHSTRREKPWTAKISVRSHDYRARNFKKRTFTYSTQKKLEEKIEELKNKVIGLIHENETTEKENLTESKKNVDKIIPFCRSIKDDLAGVVSVRLTPNEHSTAAKICIATNITTIWAEFDNDLFSTFIFDKKIEFDSEHFYHLIQSIS